MALTSRLQGNELQFVRFERVRHSANFRFHRVFKMAARAKDLDTLKACPCNLSQEFGRQFSRYEEVRRK